MHPQLGFMDLLRELNLTNLRSQIPIGHLDDPIGIIRGHVRADEHPIPTKVIAYVCHLGNLVPVGIDG